MNVCENFESDVISQSGLVLVDFYADWCGPCRQLSPVLEELSKEFPDIKFIKVNVETFKEEATKYNINSIPNLILFKDGKQLSSKIGGDSKSNIKTWIEKHMQ